MSYTAEWRDTYNKAILSFTGRNKVDVKELGPVLTKSGPLVETLVELDNTNPTTASGEELERRMKLFPKHISGFDKQKASFVKLLDAAVGQTSKATYPQAYRDLKVLKTALDSMAARIKTDYETKSKAHVKANDKIFREVEDKTKKLRKAGASDDEIKDDVYAVKAKRILLLAEASAKKAFTGALAVVQQVKADPTKATYDARMHDGGRDVGQLVVNLMKMTRDAKLQGLPVMAIVRRLAPFEADCDSFANGTKRTVDASASPQDILTRIGEFSTMVKGIVQAWPPVQTGLKKLVK